MKFLEGLLLWHIEVETKWPPFSRRPFQRIPSNIWNQHQNAGRMLGEQKLNTFFFSSQHSLNTCINVTIFHSRCKCLLEIMIIFHRKAYKWLPISILDNWIARKPNDLKVMLGEQKFFFRHPADMDGILPKGPYPPCLCMPDRALLAGYHRHVQWFSPTQSYHIHPGTHEEDWMQTCLITWALRPDCWVVECSNRNNYIYDMYRKVSNISRTKSQNLFASRLIW